VGEEFIYARPRAIELEKETLPTCFGVGQFSIANKTDAKDDQF
jgi:hypothetical protein